MTTLPSFNVIGIEVRTSNLKALFTLPKLWKRFHNEAILDQIPGRIDEATLAVYTEYEGDHTKPYTLLLGARVASLKTIPEGMVGREIPAQTYKHYPIEGKLPGAMIQTWQSIWKSDLPRAYTSDFEVYSKEKTELFLGLKSEE